MKVQAAIESSSGRNMLGIGPTGAPGPRSARPHTVRGEGGGVARQLISAAEPAACLTGQYEPGSWRMLPAKLVLCRLLACLLAWCICTGITRLRCLSNNCWGIKSVSCIIYVYCCCHKPRLFTTWH